tara:strand:+ start:339 stop:860 length:522 start_codon:yes stop_codon:yes gene_type:complete
MVRPKSSVIGFVDLGISGLNTIKVSKMNNSIEGLSSEIYNSNLRIESSLEDIRKAQIAGLCGLVKLHSSFKKLDQTQNEILQEIKRQDRIEDELGNLKIFLIQVEEELERIISISVNHLEYATMLAQDLERSLLANKITVSRFKRLDKDDIKWAKIVIENVSLTVIDLIKRLD